jgi:hypothetical protein
MEALPWNPAAEATDVTACSLFKTEARSSTIVMQFGNLHRCATSCAACDSQRGSGCSFLRCTCWNISYVMTGK